MPTPTTSRRTPNRNTSAKSTPTKPKPSGVGKLIGTPNSGTVLDKVRQWQDSGGGIVTAEDIHVEVEEDEELLGQKQGKRKKDPEPYKRPEEGLRVEHPAGDDKKETLRRTSRPELDDWDDHTRSVSAPRKRVVSDGHWRKKRSPPKETTRRTIGPDIKRKINHDVIVVEYASDNESEKPVPRDGARTTPRKSDLSNNDGIRVYATPPSSRKTSRYVVMPETVEPDHSSEGDDIGSEASEPKPELEPETLKKHEPGKRKASRGSTLVGSEPKSRRSSQQKTKTTEKSTKSPGAFTEARGSTKSHKSTILTQVFDESKKMFSRKEFVPITTPRIPSVEAWLDETPDPFIDDPETFIDVPSPLNLLARQNTNEEAVAPEDPNKIWDDLNVRDERKTVAESKRKRRVRSSSKSIEDLHLKDTTRKTEGKTSKQELKTDAVNDVLVETPETTPPSLRRRGAKRDSSSPLRERHKSSPLKECVYQNEETSSGQPTPSITDYLRENHEPLTPLKPPGLNIRRPFPSTGKHKLSTIASVETFNSRVHNLTPPSISDVSEETTRQNEGSDENERQEARDHFDPHGLDRRTNKNRIAKHDDLMSVLSLPRSSSKSIVSARSIRTSRSRLATASIEDLMSELSSDEDKYMRELRTLADGVIPVLLTCVLSKSDSAIAAGLFSPLAKAKSNSEVTQPIVDMGIALELLRKLHQRIPRQNPDSLLSWAQGAHKVYEEYLRAWRMGFQDVVVNLVPAADKPGGPQKKVEEGLPQNEDGDVVDSNGERVDVAFLLKRPLVRIKYLTKSLKAINLVRPTSEAEALTTKFQDLVTLARQRSNEERARMEDEAASSIDPTRARDPRTLGPLTGVSIDGHRRVRARDYFNLDLKHSSGQRIDCRVEFLIRDDPPDRGTGGDLLICEVDSTGRWLLFPPVQFEQVSARNGDHQGEIVVMLREAHSQAQEWHELLVLRTDDEQTGFEWVHMLGLEPVPPKVMRMESFIKRQEKRKTLLAPPLESLEVTNPPSPIGKSRTPSPREMEIPIGEQAGEKAKIWMESPLKQRENPVPSPPLKERNRLQKLLRKETPFDSLARPKSEQAMPYEALEPPNFQQKSERPKSADLAPVSRSLAEKLGFSGISSGPGLKRSKAKRLSKQIDDVNTSPTSLKDEYFKEDVCRQHTDFAQSPISDHCSLDNGDRLPLEHGAQEHELHSTQEPPKASARPRYNRSRSSAPSLDLPIIPKVRKESLPATPTYEPEEESSWPPPKTELEPPQTPPKPTKSRPTSPADTQKPPLPPAHRSPSPAHIKTSDVPDLSSAATRKATRRSSSPLKHQYEPSTASESTSDSDTSTVDHKDATSISDSSSEEELEDEDIPTPLVPLRALQRMSKSSPPATIKSGGDSIAPSQSASQAPYKRVPSQPTKSVKAVASIFCWTDSGSWQPLHPEECSINITPGLIEAFEMSAAHSSFHTVTSSQDPSSSRPSSSPPMEPPTRPLVALELTPLVPIRRGTALDISIRSPPTPSSLYTTSQNTLFRSRNPEECEALYALINHARINNPTYIALQNARLTSSFTPNFAAGQNKASRRGSWFGLGRKNSYRANSAPTPTVNTDSSGNTLAKSWLQAFGQRAGNFNLSRSTVTTSQVGSRAGSIYTDSSGSGTSTPLPLGAMNGRTAHGAAKIGLENLLIRLYLRDSGSKWRDLGRGTLNVLRPENTLLGVKPQGSERRVLITSAKNREKEKDGEKEEKKDSKEPYVLLDVTLGEAGFERVARTGIAISFWEELVDGRVAKEGGVVPGRAKVYMVQMKSEAETAYTYSMLGRMRY